MKDHLHFHTVTMNKKIYDVYKIIELCENVNKSWIPLKSFDKRFDRSKRTGFSLKRYRDADIKCPIIILQDFSILDGRHRVAKMLDIGYLYCFAKICPVNILEKCIL